MKPKTNQLKHNRKIITVCSEIHFFFHGSITLVSWDILIAEISRSHSDTPHSVGPLWTSDRSVTETSTWQHTTLTTERHPCPPAGFEPTIPAIERSRTHTLYRAATGIDFEIHTKNIRVNHCVNRARNSLMSNMVAHEVTNGLCSNMAFTIYTRHFQVKFDLM